MIRDLYMLEFLNLPEPYKEFDLKQAILKNMKQFLLEFGRDFIFMGEEYHLQLGKMITLWIFSFTIGNCSVWLPLT